MENTVFAIDLAKSVFQVAVSHYPGRVSQQRRLTRSQPLRFMGKQPPDLTLVRSCTSAEDLLSAGRPAQSPLVPSGNTPLSR
jgi:hypothetical protein